ncbi:MAG: hypothetical protein RR214_01950 [Synergistaceae bacterium]
MSVKYVNTGGGGWSPLGLLGSVPSLAVPGAAPWVAGANALNSAVRGDWGGAVKNGIGAASGFGAKSWATDAGGLTSQMESNPMFVRQNLSDLNPTLNKPVVPANDLPVTRSAGMSPDTPYSQAASMSVQQAADASKSKYDALLSMYGISPDGQGAFNHDAAKSYYRNFAVGDNPLDTEENQSVYNSLMRLMGRR